MSIMYNVLLLFPLKNNNLSKAPIAAGAFFLWGELCERKDFTF